MQCYQVGDKFWVGDRIFQVEPPTIPPLEYDHPYEGELHVVELTQALMQRICQRPETRFYPIPPAGCAQRDYPEPGHCTIHLARQIDLDQFGLKVEHAFRHEIGHCNGWRQDHKGARLIDGTPAPAEPTSASSTSSREGARIYTGDIRNPDPAPEDIAPANRAEREAVAARDYNEKLRYMREWESDPRKMKHLYKDFEEFVQVSKAAGNASKSQGTSGAKAWYVQVTKESSDRLSLECASFTTVPIEPVGRDPVVKASIHLYKAGDEKPTSFEVKHETLNGKTYARNDQYRSLRFWSDRSGDYWSGVSVKNSRRTMVGQLGYDPTRQGSSARRYIEKSFIGGRLEQTTTSACSTCASVAAEKASEQCRGVE